MAAAKNKAATAIRKEQKKDKQILLSDLLIRAPQFVAGPGKEERHDGAILRRSKGVRVRGWGRQLSFFERRVWLYVLQLAHQVPTGEPVTISCTDLRRGLGLCIQGQETAEMLDWALTGLSTYNVALETPQGKWIMPLLNYSTTAKNTYRIVVDTRWTVPADCELVW
ncbi:MAG: hypothetical protein PHI97_19530 [Desulfobulbus sp.]|nr:hypothetical protein [Desulfobulbus sp.]